MTGRPPQVKAVARDGGALALGDERRTARVRPADSAAYRLRPPCLSHVTSTGSLGMSVEEVPHDLHRGGKQHAALAAPLLTTAIERVLANGVHDEIAKRRF